MRAEARLGSALVLGLALGCGWASGDKARTARDFAQRGHKLLENREYAKAEAAYRRALDFLKGYVEAEAGLATALARQERFDDALDLVRSVLARPGLRADEQAPARTSLEAIHALAAVSSPTPREGAGGVPPDPTLTWGAPLRRADDAPPLTFALRVAPDRALLSAQSEVAAAGRSWRPREPLAAGRTYYWQIVARAPDGRATASATYSFTVAGPPPAVSGPRPADGKAVAPAPFFVRHALPALGGLAAGALWYLGLAGWLAAQRRWGAAVAAVAGAAELVAIGYALRERTIPVAVLSSLHLPLLIYLSARVARQGAAAPGDAVPGLEAAGEGAALGPPRTVIVPCTGCGLLLRLRVSNQPKTIKCPECDEVFLWEPE